VDDFPLATSDPAVATIVYDAIGTTLCLPGEPVLPFEQQVLVAAFNGANMVHTCDYIKLTSESYIRHLLAAHHWETPTQHKTALGSHPAKPLHPANMHAISTTVGATKSTPEHAKLESELGFSYRSLLGELLFAYVTTRPDIGYSITTLTKF
jgi:hypothetical protein